MRPAVRKALLALALITFGTSIGASSCNSGTAVELTIFHTNDIHSHLTAAKIDPFGLGGLARISTLLKQLRSASPNSLTVDAGDWSEGTMYYNVDDGANMLRFLDAMGYDAVCLGNHDFLNGPAQVMETIEAAKPSFPVLAANLDASSYAKAAEFTADLPSTTIKQVGGLKVGMIGLTTFGFVFNSYLSPVAITDTVSVATKLANQLRPQVDVLILISHNDFSMNQELAQAVPGIDAVISGHSHVKTPQAVLVTNAGRKVPVVETGFWGKFVGDLKLTVNQSQKSVQFESYQLHPVTPDIAEDPTIAQEVAQQTAALSAKYGNVGQTVAQADFDLEQADAQEAPLGNLAVESYLDATGAQVAVEEISLTGVSLAQGPLTMMDLHDVIPHIYNAQTGKDWTVKVWNAKGSDLRLVFEVFYTTSGLMALSSPLGWLSAAGAQVLWDPSKATSLSAVQSITVGGQPLSDTQTYTVALTDGLLQGIAMANQLLGLGIDTSSVSDTGLEAWRAVMQYAAKKQTLTVADFGVGGHTTTVGADLAVFDYGLDWDGNNLSVEVSNQGAVPSTQASLVCQTGTPNDLVDYNTGSEVWTTIGTQTVAALAPGASATYLVPWKSAGLAKGYWPVQCVVTLAGESYVSNNTGSHVFQVQ